MKDQAHLLHMKCLYVYRSMYVHTVCTDDRSTDLHLGYLVGKYRPENTNKMYIVH